MICEVGIWVLKTALEQCKVWRKYIPDFKMSINMSYIQLRQPDIAEKVPEVVEESGLHGSVLTVEITESMQLMDYPYLNEIIDKWKLYGIEISVDDFGTGYSSLRDSRRWR